MLSSSLKFVGEYTKLCIVISTDIHMQLMVDGVHGGLDNVAKHVVEEHKSILECVIILNLRVEGKNVMVLPFILTKSHAMIFAAQVRSS